MKTNTKGFTLIELLAVIVILAIIALIATPIVLGILEDARKSAAVDSAYGIIKAAELNYATELLKNPDYSVASIDVLNLSYSGTKATSGKILFDTDTGKATIDPDNKLMINTYICEMGSTPGTVTCDK